MVCCISFILGVKVKQKNKKRKKEGVRMASSKEKGNIHSITLLVPAPCISYTHLILTTTLRGKHFHSKLVDDKSKNVLNYVPQGGWDAESCFYAL